MDFLNGLKWNAFVRIVSLLTGSQCQSGHSIRQKTIVMSVIGDDGVFGIWIYLHYKESHKDNEQNDVPQTQYTFKPKQIAV